MTCVYFGELIKTDQHECRLHGRCMPGKGGRKTPGCDGCPDRLALDDPGFADKWQDGLIVTDRGKVRTHALRDLLAGRAAFLVGGGPSANENPLELLDRRGVFTFAINNVAGHSRFRANAFVCADPPSKFSHSIWLDPGIMKFIPIPKLTNRNRRGKVRRKMPDGTFVQLKEKTQDCPNVWGFQRQSWMTPDEHFLLDEGAMWGNLDSGVKRTGQPKTVCTMLMALRLLIYLGAKRIYLVGCDFYMRPDWGYSFPQGRTPGACESNNRQFSIVNSWLCELQEKGIFGRFGVSLYNTTVRSGLRAFPYVPFSDALDDVVGIVEEKPDLSAFYEKVDKEEKK